MEPVSPPDARYVVITAARNEEAFLEGTIQSVVSQTVLPLRWVIVNDGSTDSTSHIIRRRAREHAFIQIVDVERSGTRDFASKIFAFQLGVRTLTDIPYDFLGNLDADITFAPDYFASILGQFRRDSKLGLTGGHVYTKVGSGFQPISNTPDSVVGAVQMFRRRCYEQIGGYRALQGGGVDAAAEIAARMHGWRVSKCFAQRVYMQRGMGMATATMLGAKFQLGWRFHALGYRLSFYVLRCVYRLKDRPIVIGSVVELIGYLGRMARRETYVLPTELVEYLRREQRDKMAAVLLRIARRVC